MREIDHTITEEQAGRIRTKSVDLQRLDEKLREIEIEFAEEDRLKPSLMSLDIPFTSSS